MRFEILALAALPAVLARNQFIHRRADIPFHQVIDKNFADPSIIQADDGTWFAYATTANGTTPNAHIPFATSSDFKSWTVSTKDALPKLGAWAAQNANGNIWAPDVMRGSQGYVMYYSAAPASLADAKGLDVRHCIGVATSDALDKPFQPHNESFACPLDKGGAIDASGFYDPELDKQYVVYKIDSNGAPVKTAQNVKTPILLQEVQKDGYTKIGEPKTLIEFSKDDGDTAPLTEAPAIVKNKDIYYLFYSTGSFADKTYNIRYATSTKIDGQFGNKKTLMDSSNSGLIGPGGADFSVAGSNGEDGVRMAFHSLLGDNINKGRGMLWTTLKLKNGTVTFDGDLHDPVQSSQPSSSSTGKKVHVGQDHVKCRSQRRSRRGI